MTTPSDLHAIYVQIEMRVQEVVDSRPEWPCRKGCDGCCRRLARVPELTEAEWGEVQQGIEQLDGAVQQSVQSRLRELSEAPVEGPLMCPLLEPEAGICLVYAHRPATCRTYGFYVSATGNMWCDDIQTRSEAGMTDGVVLGNQDAVERELARRFGATRSLVEWFRDTL